MLRPVLELLKPFAGESNSQIDASTLTGKLMAGYQGWFRAPGDGSGKAWGHYCPDADFRPGHCKIDAWPDMSELEEDEKFATPFKHADGSTAHVFSSIHPKTVMRHFRWMKDYGLDGVFVQRFFDNAHELRVGQEKGSLQVLSLCREAANRYGRTYALMYDLSGMHEGQEDVILEDWTRLKGQMCLTEDPAYQRHRGKPVVSVWGIGFPDRPDYTLKPCKKIVDFLKKEGLCVKLGVPTGWREQKLERPYVPFGKRSSSYVDGDCQQNPLLHEIIKSADIISPWAVDRCRTPEGAADLAKNVWAGDLEWCRKQGLEFMPVAFPGFSWNNMYPQDPFNATPRLKGAFLWELYAQAIKLGVPMLYQAMFDEVDEGTAIFKCSNNPPVGESRFLDMDGVAPDHYLWLASQASKMLRKEIPLSEKMPTRPK
jgi:hypothetical protein